MTKSAAQIAAEMGMKLLTAHIGFVPPSSDPNYTRWSSAPATREDLETLRRDAGPGDGPGAGAGAAQFLNDLR
jgi:hypothetical protein